MGDKDYAGTELACFGGESGHVNHYKGPWSKRRVFCAPCPKVFGDNLCSAGPTTNQYADHNASGVGGWGGSCTCPDGQTYQVGDLWSADTPEGECGALACHGGVAGECVKKGSHEEPEPHSFNKITCAPACHSKLAAAIPAASPAPQPQCTGPTQNLVKKLVHQITQGVGCWGGSCTCPDGKVYQVGDLQRHRNPNPKPKPQT